MKRRANTSGKAKTEQRRKTANPKRRTAPAAARRKRSSDADLREQLDQSRRELKEAIEHQTAAIEVLRVIRRSPADAQPVFDAIVDSAARLCGAVFSAVYLYDRDHLRRAATNNYTPEALKLSANVRLPERSHLVGRAILDRAIVHVPDVLADPEYSRELALAGGWRAVLSVPLIRDGKPVGVVSVAKTEPVPFSDRQIQLLNTFADQAVIAIENVRLFEAEQQRTRELSEALEQQTATSEVLKVISSSPGELKPVFEAMLGNAVHICEAAFGSMLLCEGDMLRRVALHNAPPRYAKHGEKEPLIHRSKLLAHLLETRQAAQVADMAVTAPKSAISKLGGARTLLNVPMLKENEVIGVIGIYRQEVRPFTDKQIELVQNFAAQAVIAIENTRLLNELRQRTDDLSEALEQQTATSEVLQVISTSPGDLEPVFRAMLENATRICEASYGVMFRVEQGRFRMAAMLDLPPPLADNLLRDGGFVPPSPPGTPLDHVWRTKQVAATADGAALPSPSPAAMLGGARSTVAVPMLKDDELVGAFVIYRKEVRPFTDKQIELVQNFSAQAVIAIENARLLNELRQRTDDLSEALEQQTATSEVLKVISSSPGELEPVFEAMLENATRICEANFGNLCLYKDNVFHRAALHNAPQAWIDDWKRDPRVERSRPGAAHLLYQVADTKRPIHIADLKQDYPNTPIVKQAGARTLAVVPLLKDEVILGAIGIYRREVRPFTGKQIELLQNFAAQAVIAIENARLLNELRQRTDDLSEALEQQTATSEVLQVISSSPGQLEPVFQAMLGNAVQICGAKFGILYLSEDNGFRTVAMHDVPRAFAERREREPFFYPPEGSPLGRIMRTRQIAHIADITMEQGYAEGHRPLMDLAEFGGARTVVAVPMLKESELVGAVTIYRQEVRPFTDKQIAFVSSFAAQAVIAIENARLLNELRQRTDDLSEALEQQTATSEVLKVISTSPGELEPIFGAMLENAVRICGAKFGNLLLVEDSAFRQVALYGAPQAFLEERQREPVIRPRPGSDLDQILKHKNIVHIADMRLEGAAATTAIVELAGARTFLSVPLLKDNEFVGTIGIYSQEVKPFTDKQIQLVKNFAAQAVIAIENTRLLNELRQRTTDLSKSLENLRTAQDRLVQTEKLASLGQLTAGIAHEIKNPLNFVNNFSAVSVELIDELREALSSAHLDSKLRADISEIADMLQGNLDKVVQHGKRADSIVKNMLLHSRQGSGERRPVDINALVEESLNLAYHGARAEKQGFNITIERSFDPAAGEADIFPQEITRVLLNLISNGFYAATKRKAEAGDGGYEPTLAAATKDLGDRVEVRIRDNGTGIPPEVREKMFNPFFTTKPAGEGTGLGLSISHDIIVKQHGGSIEVDTQPGEFTEFRIILPRGVATIVR